MALSVISFLLFTLVIMAVRATGLGASTPMEKAFQDVRLLNNRGGLLSRRARDTMSEEMPCVSIPFLTVLKERFTRWLDKDNNGISTFDEVKEYLQRFNANVKDDVVKAFIRRRDMNGNGAIDFAPEYVQNMVVSDYTTEGAREGFNLQDINDDGFVDEKELLDGAQAIGMTHQEAMDTTQNYYMVADADKDGKLSFDEFKTLYSQ